MYVGVLSTFMSIPHFHVLTADLSLQPHELGSFLFHVIYFFYS